MDNNINMCGKVIVPSDYSAKSLDNYFCGICHDLAVKPVKIKAQTYCLKCVEEWSKIFKAYPGQNGNESITPINIPVHSCKDQITFYCDYEGSGCEAGLTRNEFESHVKSCQSNPYKVYEEEKGTCSLHNCVSRSEFETHVKFCQFKPSHTCEQHFKSNQDNNELKEKLNTLTEEIIELKKEIQDLKNKEKDDKNKTQPTGIDDMTEKLSEINSSQIKH